jgi:hypothetical protein
MRRRPNHPTPTLLALSSNPEADRLLRYSEPFSVQPQMLRPSMPPRVDFQERSILVRDLNAENPLCDTGAPAQEQAFAALLRQQSYQ